MFRNKIFKNLTKKASLLFRKGIRGQELYNRKILIEDCNELLNLIERHCENIRGDLFEKDVEALRDLKEDLELEVEHMEILAGW